MTRTARRRERPSRRLGLLIAAVAGVVLLVGIRGTNVATPTVVRADVAVYGASAAGAVAALSAARAGATTLLLTGGLPLGGMLASGLSATDLPPAGLIRSIPLEFFQRVASRLDDTGDPELLWSVSPNATTLTFRELLASAKVPIIATADIPIADAVTVRDGSITGLRVGSVEVDAKTYVDASYEGDLLAAAGVPSTLGREAASAFGESLAGYRPAIETELIAAPGASPPAGFAAVPARPPGTGDGAVQAMSYRPCLTAQPDNRLPFTRPDRYDPSTYAFVARSIAADLSTVTDPLATVLKLSPVAGGRFDLNSASWFGLDDPAVGRGWSTSDAAGRATIAAELRNYDEGLLWFLGHDPSVPAAVSAAISPYGLCRNEFGATGGWPPEPYVREGRRLLGRAVLTQADVETGARNDQPIAVGGYRIDSHQVARYVDDQGRAVVDGILDAPTRPYAIPLGSILPTAGAVSNLAAVVAISATHVAYSSVRIEATLMAIGEAGGLLAAEAAQQHVALAEVSYAGLRAALMDREALPPGW